jgi:hypothetical protein
MQIETEVPDDTTSPFRPSAKYNTATDRWESDDPAEASLVLWLNTSATRASFGDCSAEDGPSLITRVLKGAGWLVVRGVAEGVERVITKRGDRK